MDDRTRSGQEEAVDQSQGLAENSADKEAETKAPEAAESEVE